MFNQVLNVITQFNNPFIQHSVTKQSVKSIISQLFTINKTLFVENNIIWASIITIKIVLCWLFKYIEFRMEKIVEKMVRGKVSEGELLVYLWSCEFV